MLPPDVCKNHPHRITVAVGAKTDLNIHQQGCFVDVHNQRRFDVTTDPIHETSTVFYFDVELESIHSHWDASPITLASLNTWPPVKNHCNRDCILPSKHSNKGCHLMFPLVFCRHFVSDIYRTIFH